MTRKKKNPTTTQEEQQYITALADAIRLFRGAADALATAKDKACRLALRSRPASDRITRLLRCMETLDAVAWTTKVHADLLECDAPIQAIRESGVWDHDGLAADVAAYAAAQK